MKIGCVVQGDLRIPLKPILNALSNSFNSIVVSTWLEDKDKCPSGKYELVLNEKPICRGVTNRNLQRYSTARGIDALERQGCTHVLKWRTDLLPTKLNVKNLIQLSELKANNELGGGIVTGCFRHLSVNPDWFSSFPDLYSFSTIEAAKLLWSDEEFSYNKHFNMPVRMSQELEIITGNFQDTFKFRGKEHNLLEIYSYSPHTELYAIFKDRIEKKLSTRLTHPEIISKFFTLIDDDSTGICWLASVNPLKFRPIRQGYNIKWWQQTVTRQFNPTIYSIEDLQKPLRNIISRVVFSMPVRYEIFKQFANFLLYEYNSCNSLEGVLFKSKESK